MIATIKLRLSHLIWHDETFRNIDNVKYATVHLFLKFISINYFNVEQQIHSKIHITQRQPMQSSSQGQAAGWTRRSVDVSGSFTSIMLELSGCFVFSEPSNDIYCCCTRSSNVCSVASISRICEIIDIFVTSYFESINSVECCTLYVDWYWPDDNSSIISDVDGFSHRLYGHALWQDLRAREIKFPPIKAVNGNWSIDDKLVYEIS